MKFFLRLLYFLICLSFFSILFNHQILADNEFRTDLNIDYFVAPDATLKVNQKISLTNKHANIYAKDYELSFGTTKISQLNAWDDFGTINPQVENQPNSIKVKLKLNRPVVGLDKQLSFGLSYETLDFSHLNGQVLEIGLPKIVNIAALDSCNVNLYVPLSFKDPYLMLPKPAKIEIIDNNHLYRFTKNELIDQSLIASFGESQVLNFKLLYHLTNPLPTNKLLNITLPPDTPWQKIYLEEISPKPVNIIPDDDGNWLASYLVKKDSDLNIIATGSAEIFLKPQEELTPELIKNKSLLLQSQKYWEVDDLQISQIAKTLSDPESIFNWVVKTLDYDYEKLNQPLIRIGALEALKHPQSAVCQEFTDLFITLARAKGIPAREVTGFSYTDNTNLRPLASKQEFLHSWPQYYDEEKKLWLSVDPTWTKTTGGIDYFHSFDLDHFSFVFHGQDSQFPLSPGNFRTTTAQSNIEVVFGKKPKVLEKYEVKLELPKNSFSGKTLNVKLKIINLGNTACHKVVLDYHTTGLLNISKQEIIEVIPPYSTKEIILDLPKINIFSFGDVNFHYQFKNLAGLEKVKIISPFNWPLIALEIGVILILFLIVLFLKRIWKND